MGTSEARARSGGARDLRTEALLWSGLLAAFSPTLLDLGQHLLERPWLAYALVFPLLFARCARQESSPSASGGLGWVAAGLALELVVIFLGGVRWARPALALAATGLCRHLGVGTWRSRLLLWLAVPLPSVLIKAVGRPLQMFWSRSAAELASFFSDARVAIDGYDLVTPAGRLGLTVYDGPPLAVLLAGLAWYAGIRLHRPPLRAALLSAAAAALALPLQLLATLAALGLTAAGGGPAARLLLTHAPWLAVTGLALAVIEGRARRLA